jgi:membrane protease YdiL (CAAX protease family)
MLNNEVVAFLIVLFASWVMSRIERRRIGDYGLPLRRAFRSQFWQGAAIGFAALSVLLGAMRLAGAFRIGTMDLHGADVFGYAALWALAFVFVGFFEEFFFRGYALFTRTTGITFWPAAILLSGFFGWIHHSNPGESWVSAIEAGGTGLLFCFILRRTGDLWMPIGFHAAWDWGETYSYGVPDSGFAAKGHLFHPAFTGPAWLTGGTVGPEGSWLCLALLVILWIGFAVWLRAKRYPNPA